MKSTPFLAALVAGLALALLAPARAADDTNAFFPIMAWNHAPNDPEVLRTMRDCGLTVAGFVAPATLDACQAAGLKGIVSDPRCHTYDWLNVDAAKARENVTALVRETAQHPAVYGYYLVDEPSARLYPGLEKVASVIRELAPGKWPYINLFPNYANGDQMGVPTYPEYVEQFVTTCHPPILSYDHYALMDDGSLREGYWNNLEQMRAAALKHRVPFWNIVLATPHFNYREPTQADVLFQVYSTLACGGRGLAYFTYFTSTTGNYRHGPIDQFGHRTPAWERLRYANLQVLKLAPTLLQLRSDDVYHFGGVPDGSRGPGERSLLTGAGGEVAVGEFTHTDGSRYLLVVNRNVVKSSPVSLQFRTPPQRLRKVCPYTGRLAGYDGENPWLAPGQGVLLRVE